MMSWDAVRVFLAIHRAGSYDGAAQALGMDASTVRRKIQSFEADLGATLFQRSEGRLVISPTRGALLEVALTMEKAAVGFTDEARATQHAGPIRASMLDVFAKLLAPDLAAFSAAHPAVCLDVTTEPHFVDLDKDNVDLAIRLARPVRGQHGLRRLASVAFGVYGTEDYLAAKHDREGLDILALWPHFSHNDHDFALADTRWFQSLPGTHRVAARTDNYPMLLNLCEAGLGVAMLPRFLGQGHPTLRLLDGWGVSLRIDAYLVVRKDAARLSKLRRLIDTLVEAFRTLSPLLEHGGPLADPTERTFVHHVGNSAKLVGRNAMARHSDPV